MDQGVEKSKLNNHAGYGFAGLGTYTFLILW